MLDDLGVFERVDELMNDVELVEAARREMNGEVRRGFATVIVSAPEDQLDLARAFGEELVLVPKAALDPENPGRWYRLSLDAGARVVPVDGPVPLARYTQYRDLFAFDYERLPEPLRTLRRQVVARSDVYLFAALIPAAEWAVVIGRREDALAQSTRSLEEVESFVLRAVRRTDGSFDFDVDEIAFADGTRFHLSQPRR